MSKILIIKDANFSNVAYEHVNIHGDDSIIYYDYIAFNNTFVRTNIKLKANTKIMFTGVVTGWTTGYTYAHLMGARTDSLASSDKISIALDEQNGFGPTTVVGAMDNYITSGIPVTINLKYSFTLDVQNSKFYVNGNEFNLSIPSVTPGTYPLFLGNTSLNDEPLPLGQALVGKIYEIFFYEGSTLVGYYKPCSYYGRPGFIDTLSNTFYGNGGSGTLTPGDD